jgi:hypothetical protein
MFGILYSQALETLFLVRVSVLVSGQAVLRCDVEGRCSERDGERVEQLLVDSRQGSSL